MSYLDIIESRKELEKNPLNFFHQLEYPDYLGICTCKECGHKFDFYKRNEVSLALLGFCFPRYEPEYRTITFVGGMKQTIQVS